MRKVAALALTALAAMALTVAACSEAKSRPVFYVSAIPDQNAATLARAYDGLTAYLSKELGVEVKYLPTVDYSATVVAFKRGDVHLAFFGGLTGVQARQAVPDSRAIAQRPRDAEFHSRFIVQAGVEARGLADLRGLTFTFGSESSTSGHLMPRYFLLQAGIDPETDFRGKPNFSGSHDKTWKLVESGAFQAGVLNEAVWEDAVRSGRVDGSKVRELSTTPPYFDYHWLIRGDVDEVFGAGFAAKVQRTLLAMGADQGEILDLFSTDRFVETNNGNYEAILEVAKSLGIIQ